MTTKLLTDFGQATNGAASTPGDVVDHIIWGFPDLDRDPILERYLQALNDALPTGVTIHANGDVYGPVDSEFGAQNLYEVDQAIDFVELLG